MHHLPVVRPHWHFRVVRRSLGSSCGQGQNSVDRNPQVPGRSRRFLSAPFLFGLGQGSVFLPHRAPGFSARVPPHRRHRRSRCPTGALRPSPSASGGSVPGAPLSRHPPRMSRASPLAGTYHLSCGQLLIRSTLMMGVTKLLPRTLCGLSSHSGQHLCRK